jgi:hypothetical protein
MTLWMAAGQMLYLAAGTPNSLLGIAGALALLTILLR